MFLLGKSILYFLLLCASPVIPLEYQELNQETENCPWEDYKNSQYRGLISNFSLLKNGQMIEMMSVILFMCS